MYTRVKSQTHAVVKLTQTKCSHKLTLTFCLCKSYQTLLVHELQIPLNKSLNENPIETQCTTNRSNHGQQIIDQIFLFDCYPGQLVKRHPEYGLVSFGIVPSGPNAFVTVQGLNKFSLPISFFEAHLLLRKHFNSALFWQRGRLSKGI